LVSLRRRYSNKLNSKKTYYTELRKSKGRERDKSNNDQVLEWDYGREGKKKWKEAKNKEKLFSPLEFLREIRSVVWLKGSRNEN
jgi:hypothetical protein